jgi:hypothetical protein
MDVWTDKVNNPEELLKLPRNSIIARIITDGADKQNEKATICYPFFPPYLCFPIKVGEQVWIMSDSAQPGALSYWMCRIPEADYIDDLNYTHADRKFDSSPEPSTEERAALENEAGEDLTANDKVPGFPNGGMTDDSFTLHSKEEEGVAAEAYEELLDASTANDSVTFEPVPRFTKRPGDLVLQGSNNTLICLGEDRGYPLELHAEATDITEAEWSNASSGDPADENERAFSGTIDIVVGRGRPGPAAAGDDPELTWCRTIANAREYEEVDKNPIAAETTTAGTAPQKDPPKNAWDRPSEGDPDFMKDAARIYVSMKTDGDLNFGLDPDADPAGMIKGMNHDIENVDEAAYIIAKADEIRIVARKNEADDPTGYPEVAGSIRLIKEGAIGEDDDYACVILNNDGKISISGNTIHLGRDSENDGRGDDSGGHDGETPADGEPWMRYSDFCHWADGLIDAINANFAHHAAAIVTNGTGINDMGGELSAATGFASNAPIGFGIPEANIISAGISVTTAGGMGTASQESAFDDQGEQDAISGFKSAESVTHAIKSLRIFGE